MRETMGRKETSLDEAIAAVRDDKPLPGAAERAAARVWERLVPAASGLAGVETIEGCADVRGAASRASARRAAARARAPGGGPPAGLRGLPRRAAAGAAPPLAPRLAKGGGEPRPRRRARGARGAIAASVLLAAGVSAWAVQQAFFGVPAGSRAAVQAVSGGLQRVGRRARGEPRPRRGGRGGGAGPQPPRASRAVLRLRDGSTVEMGERAELSVTARGNDTTIHLTRGSIIVQAAKRRTGHLRVASGDCNRERDGHGGSR